MCRKSPPAVNFGPFEFRLLHLDQRCMSLKSGAVVPIIVLMPKFANVAVGLDRGTLISRHRPPPPYSATESCFNGNSVVIPSCPTRARVQILRGTAFFFEPRLMVPSFLLLGVYSSPVSNPQPPGVWSRRRRFRFPFFAPYASNHNCQGIFYHEIALTHPNPRIRPEPNVPIVPTRRSSTLLRPRSLGRWRCWRRGSAWGGAPTCGQDLSYRRGHPPRREEGGGSSPPVSKSVRSLFQTYKEWMADRGGGYSTAPEGC